MGRRRAAWAAFGRRSHLRIGAEGRVCQEERPGREEGDGWRAEEATGRLGLRRHERGKVNPTALGYTDKICQAARPGMVSIPRYQNLGAVKCKFE